MKWNKPDTRKVSCTGLVDYASQENSYSNVEENSGKKV